MDVGEASVNFSVNSVPDGSQTGQARAACYIHRTNLHPGCLLHRRPVYISTLTPTCLSLSADYLGPAPGFLRRLFLDTHTLTNSITARKRASVL